MKRSKAITLVLLTSTIFLGCERDVRNQYASWDDCVQDFKDPKKCQEEKQTTSTGYRSYYYGPWYRPSQINNPAYNPSMGTRKAVGITRAGWGSTAMRSISS
jgi:uncharacterized protein YgiB involved in biofilm formation